MQATRDFSYYVKDLGSGLSHIDLAVEGVNCAGCMSKIERGLSALPEVTLARVNLTDRRVALEWKAGALDPARFVDRLAELGYKAYPFEPVRQRRTWPGTCAVAVSPLCRDGAMMCSYGMIRRYGDSEQRDFFHWLSALIAA